MVAPVVISQDVIGDLKAKVKPLGCASPDTRAPHHATGAGQCTGHCICGEQVALEAAKYGRGKIVGTGIRFQLPWYRCDRHSKQRQIELARKLERHLLPEGALPFHTCRQQFKPADPPFASHLCLFFRVRGCALGAQPSSVLRWTARASHLSSSRLMLHTPRTAASSSSLMVGLRSTLSS